MSNDEEYREVIRRFYEVYRPLQKRHNLRLHSHFSIYDDGLIEIWEYKGEQRSKCVCKVKGGKTILIVISVLLRRWKATGKKGSA